MKDKIICGLILLISFLYIFNLIGQIRTTKKELKSKENQLSLILEKNQIYINDLKSRNEELKIRNEEFKEYQKQLETIDDDCLNRSINPDIIKLLQKAGI